VLFNDVHAVVQFLQIRPDAVSLILPVDIPKPIINLLICYGFE